MPSLGLAVEPPPPLGSPQPHLSLSEHDELTTQLQGLHQLHIQLETAIAFLEGREPHGVPLFEGEFQELISNIRFCHTAATATTTDTSAGEDDSPQNSSNTTAAEAQQQFTELMAQISEIQRDFGKLKLQQRRQQREEEENDGSGGSSDEESIEEEKEETLKLMDLHQEESTNTSSFPSYSPSASSSQNEDSFSVTSTAAAEEAPPFEERESSYNHHSTREVKLLLNHRNSEMESEKSIESTSSDASTDDNDAAIAAMITTSTTAAELPDAPDDDANTKEDFPSASASASPSSATLRLQLIQARRQVESRGREIARLQGVVKSLEAKALSAAAPKAVMAQAAEMQKKYLNLEIKLRNAELDASEAKLQVSTLQKAAKEREKEFADMKKPSEVAVEQWQQGKKLQKRIDSLQSKLQEKSKETEAATKAQEMLQSQVNRLKNELKQSQTTKRELLVKLETQELKYSGGPGGTKSVPGTVVKKLNEEMEALQQRHDTLERQLAAVAQGGGGKQQTSTGVYSSFSAPVSPAIHNGNNNNTQGYYPSRYTESTSAMHIANGNGNGGAGSSASVARDLKILDLELERDQAIARAARLQERLQFVLEELGQSESSAESKVSPYLLQKQDPHRRSSGGSSTTTFGSKNKGKSSSSSSEREKELLDTIFLLKSALEKTRKGLENGVSSAKYMHAVEKAKQAAERVKELEIAMKDAEMHQERVAIAQREAADAQVMISALRGQLRDAKRRVKENAAAKDEIMNAQIAELERAVRERDAQLAVLRHSACDEARALVAEGLTPKMVVDALLSARAELAAALEREEALKRELAPFDAVFFAELHQLKREHEELRMMCASYQSRTK